MSNEVIQAKYDELESLTIRFRRASEEVRGMEGRLKASVAALRGGGWQGEGAGSFFAEVDDTIFPAVARLMGALQKGADTTTAMGRILQEAEEEAARLFTPDALTTPGADGQDQEANNVRSPEELREKYGKDYLDITQWEKIQGKLFVEGKGEGRAIHPNDTTQGQIGDCFLATSLASLAEQNPDVLKNAIRDNGDGTYTVTFYREKDKFLGIFGGGQEEVKVTVTAEFPVTAEGDRPYIHANQDREGQERELWPALIEKAYIRYAGGENDLRAYNHVNKEGGSPHAVLEALTGVSSSTHDARHYDIKELARMEKGGYAITLSTYDDYGGRELYKQGTLSTNHAYYITAVDEKNNTVTVRNPWGWERTPIILSYDELKNFQQITVNPTKK